MANGFRLVGGSYARKNGSSGNSGLTDALPKQTASQAAAVGSGDIILLSGDYTESAYSNTTRKLIADGMVRIKGVNPLSSTFAGVPVNMQIDGFLTVNLYANTSNVIISNCTNVTIGSYVTFLNCIFINCGNITFTGLFYNTTLYFSTVNVNNLIINNTSTATVSGLYVDFYTIISGNATSLFFINSNIQGAYLKSGVYYAAPTGTDCVISGGTATVPTFASRTMPTGTYPTLATDWLHVALGQSATACYVTNGIFNKNPKYVDVANKNFDYLSDSPHIGKSIGGGSGRVVSQSVIAYANTFTDLTNMTGTTNLTPTSTSGSAMSPVMTIDAVNPRLVGYIGYGGELNYNISTAAPSTGVNDNVPFVASYTKNGSPATNTSCRLCVMIRFSNKNTTPSATTNSDWDNGNGSTSPITGVLAGEWILAELNQVFKYDSNGFGNGDDNFSGAGNQIQAKYYQTKPVLVDNYNQG